VQSFIHCLFHVVYRACTFTVHPLFRTIHSSLCLIKKIEKFQKSKYNFFSSERTFSPGLCYEPGPKVLQPQHITRATWRPLVPVHKQPGLKALAFSPALLVLVASTGTNEPYKPGPMAFFPPVSSPSLHTKL
jgi:hypothetical protein